MAGIGHGKSPWQSATGFWVCVQKSYLITTGRKICPPPVGIGAATTVMVMVVVVVIKPSVKDKFTKLVPGLVGVPRIKPFMAPGYWSNCVGRSPAGSPAALKVNASPS